MKIEINGMYCGRACSGIVREFVIDATDARLKYEQHYCKIYASELRSAHYIFESENGGQWHQLRCTGCVKEQGVN